jgi:methylenetetrahydrofolate dehydrogenase (NADP+)/methenyltetrahydrofolate cyclohydrolase
MEPTVLSGKKVSDEILTSLTKEIATLEKQHHLNPGLAVILIGQNPASESYVRMKKNACARIGIRSFEYKLPEETSESDLIQLIDTLNQDRNVHGILLQLPLPPHINEQKMLDLISPDKDVDGFHPVNVGKLFLNLDSFKPCTPYGICKLLHYYKIPVAQKQVVILGRSNIVGKPLALMLMQNNEYGNATVTVCHSKTRNLKEITKKADILISAIGKPYYVTKNMVKEGMVIIDVGTNRVEDKANAKGYRIVGDVDYQEVAPLTSAISPVPGGVGPMTIAMLMKNTVKSFKQSLTN